MQVDVGGYHSDVGRTYALEATAEQQAVYDALRDALAAVVAAIGPGVPMRDVWAVGTERMEPRIRQLQPGASRSQRRTGPQLRGAALHRGG